MIKYNLLSPNDLRVRVIKWSRGSCFAEEIAQQNFQITKS